MASGRYYCSKNECSGKANKDDREFRTLYLLSCAHSICEACLTKVVRSNDSFVKCDRCAFNTNVDNEVVKNVHLSLNGHESSFTASNTGIKKLSANNSEILPVDSFTLGQAFNSGAVEARKTVETIDIDLDNEMESEPKSRVSAFDTEESDHFVATVGDRIRAKSKPEFLEVVEFAIKSYSEQKQSLRSIIGEKIKLDSQAVNVENDVRENFHFLHSILQIREMEAIKDVKDVFRQKEAKLTLLEEQLAKQRKALKLLILKATQVNAEEDKNKLQTELLAAASQNSVFSAESNLPVNIFYDDNIRRNLRHYADVSRDVSAISNAYKLSSLPAPVVTLTPAAPVASTSASPAKSTTASSKSTPEIPTKANGTTTIEIVETEMEDLELSQEVEEVTVAKIPKIQRLKEEIVRVTNIVNPEHFYVIPSSLDENANDLRKEINQLCKSQYHHPPALNSWNQGDFCFAFSDVFNEWCRARFEYLCEEVQGQSNKRNVAVFNVLKSYKANVFLLDYGANADVDSQSLREKKDELFDFKSYPLRCIRCSLYNIKPYPSESWNNKAGQTFYSFAIGREMLMYVKETVDGITYVDLSHYEFNDVSSGKSSLIEILVFMGAARFKLGENNEHQFTRNPIKTYPNFATFELGQSSTILPVHVETPDLFYVNISNAQSKVVDLFKALQVYENDKEMPPELYRVYLPRVNLPCVAKFKDNMWYRALITKINSPEEVSVQFVDYGNEDVRKTSDLRLMKDVFLTLSKQAIPCNLADIRPLHSHKWSDNAINAFKDLIAGETSNGGQLLTMTVYGYDDNRKASVALHRFDGMSTSMNINAALVTEGFAESCGSLSVSERCPNVATKVEDAVAPAMLDNTSLSAYNVLKEIQERNESGKASKRDSLIKVIVSHWTSPDQFWIQIATKELIRYFKSFEDCLTNQMNNENSYHSKLGQSTANQKVEVGDMCLYRKLVGDELFWRRGKVYQKLRSDSSSDPRSDEYYNYLVYSVDYGDKMELKRSDLVKLSPNSPFVKNKDFAIQCHIVGIKPAGASEWTRTALERFQLFLSKHQNNLQILVKEPLPEESPESVGVSLIALESIITGPIDPRKDTYLPFKNLLMNEGVAMPITMRKKDTTESDDENDLNCANPALGGDQFYKNPMPFSMKNESSLLSKLKKEHRLKEVQNVDPNVKYLEPDFPIDQTFKAVVTDVDHDLQIYFRILPNEPGPQPIQTINNAILNAMRDREALDPFSGAISVGRACSAYFDFDQTWNRAEIEGVVRDHQSNSGILQVRFVDYGNVDQVYTEKLSSEVFCPEIPKLALYGKLYNCKPYCESIVPKLISELRGLIDKTLTFRWENYLVNKLPMKISIEVPELGNLKNILLNKDLVVDDFETDDFPRDALRAIKSIESSEFIANDLRFSVNVYYPVVISHPVEFNYVFLQALRIDNPTTDEEYTISKQHDCFVDMIEIMRAEHSRHFFNQVGRKDEDSAICAQFPEDGEWYRCTVLRNSWSGSGTEVLYIDYGNTATVRYDQIRELPEKFINGVPAHAFLAMLSNIRPRRQTWKSRHSQLIASFLPKLEGRNLVALFTSNSFPFSVDLYETSSRGSRNPVRHALRDLVNSGEFEFVNTPFC